MAAVEQRQQREVEARNRELAAKVLQATFDQLVANIRQDIALLQTHLPNKETEALEASLDAKYLKDRQQTFGRLFSSRKFVSQGQVFGTLVTSCFIARFLLGKEGPRMVRQFHGAEVQACDSRQQFDECLGRLCKVQPCDPH